MVGFAAVCATEQTSSPSTCEMMDHALKNLQQCYNEWNQCMEDLQQLIIKHKRSTVDGICKYNLKKPNRLRFLDTILFLSTTILNTDIANGV